MTLKVIIEDQSYTLPVADDFVQQAASFFEKMDADMDKGWQMAREWIETPDSQQKLTIVADKLLTAIENDEKNTAMMMVGYIRSRAPSVVKIEMDVTGEMGHDFIEAGNEPDQSLIDADPSMKNSPLRASSEQRSGLDKMTAMQMAGNEVSRVFKAGKQYKFSMYNPDTGNWEESPAIADKDEAEKMREFAFKKRFDQLTG